MYVIDFFLFFILPVCILPYCCSQFCLHLQAQLIAQLNLFTFGCQHTKERHSRVICFCHPSRPYFVLLKIYNCFLGKIVHRYNNKYFSMNRYLYLYLSAFACAMPGLTQLTVYNWCPRPLEGCWLTTRTPTKNQEARRENFSHCCICVAPP